MHRVIARLRGERGFTIIELLVSMLLMGGGVFAAVGAFGDSLNGAATAQQIDVATATGTQALEEMRAAPYAQLAVQNVAGAPAMSSGDPRERVTGTKYQVPGGAAEDLVTASPSSQFKDVETVTVGGQTMRIYRFVSWRDEECPIVDLSNLEGTLTNLRSALLTTTGLLSGLTGASGSLTTTIANGTSLLGSGLLSGVLAGLLTPVTNMVNSGLKPINTLLTAPALLAPLQSLLAKIDTVLDPVTHHITGALDLCDIPSGALPDVGQLALINSTLPALNTALTSLGPLVTTASGIINSLASLNLFTLTQGLTQLVPATNSAAALLASKNTISAILGGVVDTAGNPTQLATLATSSVSGLGSLVGFLASPNTTHNTKRISVAVWLQDRKIGYGPNKPIWLSTVAIDPSEGLL